MAVQPVQIIKAVVTMAVYSTHYIYVYNTCRPFQLDGLIVSRSSSATPDILTR